MFGLRICTTDRCQSGACVHTRDGLLGSALCGGDAVDTKLAGAITAKATKARDLVHKASGAGSRRRSS
jgi:hypothetical protein